MIAGEFSDVLKLTFESTTIFIDSKTVQINLNFDEKLQISLFSEAERVLIRLWGVFVSKSDHSFLSD